jgi:hypothetical protein
MSKIVWTYGLIAGALFALEFGLAFGFLDVAESSAGLLIGYTTMVAVGVLTYFGVRRYRDTVLNGTIGFGRAAKAAALISLISSACYVATWEVMLQTSAKGFGDKYAAAAIAKAKANPNITPQQLEAQERSMKAFAENYKHPLYRIAMTLVEPLPVAIIAVFVTAFAVSRRRRDAAGQLAGSPS